MKITAILQKLSGALRHLLKRPEFHHEVVLVGPDAAELEHLAGALLRSERDNVNLLHCEAPEADHLRAPGAIPMREALIKAGQSLSLPLLYLPSRGHGRRQRWNLRLAPMQQTAADSANPWKLAADLWILCWPARMLGEETQGSTDLRIHFSGILGRARDQGRARRAAVAITGLSAENAPRHESQTCLDVPLRRSLRESTQKALRSGMGSPGDGAADPHWRAVLGTMIAGDRCLAALQQLVQRCLGRACPVFFAPGDGDRLMGMPPLVEWLHKGRSLGASRSLPHSPLVTAGIGLCLLAGVLLYPLPKSAADQLSSASPDSIIQTIDERIDAYGRLDLQLAAVLGADTSAPGRSALEHSRHLVNQSQFLAECRLYQRRLERIRDAELNRVTADPGLDRPALATSLLDHLRREEPTVRDWQRRATELGLDPGLTPALMPELGHAAILALLLTLESGDGEPGAVRATALTNDVSTWCESHTSQEFRPLLRAIRSATDTEAIQQALGLFNDPTGRDATGLRYVPALPSSNVNGTLRGLEALSIEQLIADPQSVRSRLSRAEQLLRSQLHPNEATTLGLERVRALRDNLNALLAPRIVLVRFIIPGWSSWHVDVSRSREAGFEAAQWAEPGPTGDQGCVARLSQFRLGDRFYVSLNPQTADHVVSGQSTGPCTENNVVAVRLDRRQGTIRFPAFQDEVEFEVIRGWPTQGDGNQ